jgi:hypothetical protein
MGATVAHNCGNSGGFRSGVSIAVPHDAPGATMLNPKCRWVMTAWDRQNRDFLLPICNIFQKYDAAQTDRRGHDQ